MNRLALLLIPLIVIASCKQKQYTLAELQKAKWDSLAPGIYYLSTKDGSTLATDSVELTLKGIFDGKENPVEIHFTDLTADLNWLVTGVVKKSLRDSKEGYLKVNLPDMLRPQSLKGMVYLRGDYDFTSAIARDRALLKQMPGIKEVAFVSKETAASIYLKADSTGWSKVLDANPFPNSFEITLEPLNWDSVSIKDLETTILNQLPMASEFSYASYLLMRTEQYHFFSYKVK